MYQSFITKLEVSSSLRNAPHKSKHSFDWGLQHLGLLRETKDPQAALREFTKQNLESPSAYFLPSPVPLSAYQLRKGTLSFPSTIKTFHSNNDLVRCRFHPRKEARAAILVVPHWNGGGESYDRLCKFLNTLGYSAMWLSLPFHGERGEDLPAEWSTSLPSTLMVTADIGLTLTAMRQAVQDTLSAVTWLLAEGHSEIALQGASIGSCVAFLAAAHDCRVNGLFANLMSSYFGEVVWAGISTRHVRDSVEHHLDLAGLRQALMLNSPIAFVDSLERYNPGLIQCIVSGRFDSTFPFYLTEKMIDALRTARVGFDHRTLPCGHYTLGAFPFRYIDGFYLWDFYRRLFAK